MTLAVTPPIEGPVWLRSRTSDSMFIAGTAGIALVSDLVVARPSLFGVVHFLDIWLLGYHHIFDPITRGGF